MFTFCVGQEQFALLNGKEHKVLESEIIENRALIFLFLRKILQFLSTV
jgi:hypothetical protein